MTGVQIAIIDKAVAPAAPRTSIGLAAEFEGALARLVAGKVLEIRLDGVTTKRGARAVLTRAAKRRGCRLVQWDVDGVLYAELAGGSRAAAVPTAVQTLPPASGTIATRPKLGQCGRNGCSGLLHFESDQFGYRVVCLKCAHSYDTDAAGNRLEPVDRPQLEEGRLRRREPTHAGGRL